MVLEHAAYKGRFETFREHTVTDPSRLADAGLQPDGRSLVVIDYGKTEKSKHQAEPIPASATTYGVETVERD